MVCVLVEHAVEDYETWKEHFDEHASTREEFGEQGYRLFCGTNDPNEVCVLLEWDSAENARSFMADSDVREVMEIAGVIGEPEIRFLDEMETRAPGRPTA